MGSRGRQVVSTNQPDQVIGNVFEDDIATVDPEWNRKPYCGQAGTFGNGSGLPRATACSIVQPVTCGASAIPSNRKEYAMKWRSWIGVGCGMGFLIPTAQVVAFEGRINLTLDGALNTNYKVSAPANPKPLNVYLTCEKGVWEGGWGECQTFNRAIHEVAVSDFKQAGQKMTLRLEVQVYPDNWIKGGPARYEVEAAQTGDRLEGSYAGMFDGTPPSDPFPCKGRVTGEVLPPQAVDPQWKPIEIGEHPRMLCRKFQIPALREKAGTPFGRALLEKIRTSNDAVSQGFMYQMTGDKAYAEKAFVSTVATMANRNGGPFALGRFWGYRTSVVGTAYDLCYDAWTPSQRELVENYLDWILFKCEFRKHRVGTVNWAPGSNYTIVIHPGNAMGALALWGEKGPGPLEPIPPRTEPAQLAGDYVAPAGVPVTPLVPGLMPAQWLGIGPFVARVSQHMHPFYQYVEPFDCLASGGGMSKVRPEPGQKVAFRAQQLEWKPCSLAEAGKDWDGKAKLSPSAVGAKDQENTFIFFYTVLAVEQPGWFKVQVPFYDGKCFLAGERFADGEFVHLAKGQYPALVCLSMGDGEYRATFSLASATEEEARAFYSGDGLQKAYASNRRKYEADLAKWKSSGERDLLWMRMAEAYRRWCYLALQQGMGDGGFQSEGEGYTLECHHVIHDYACMYRNAFGRSVTGRPDISHFAPRYVFMALWNGDRAWQQSFGGHGGGTMPPRYFARSIALCPAEWQPALLWHWLKLMNVTAGELESGSGVEKAFSGDNFDEGLERVQAFINYPLGVKPRAPGEVLPHVWHAAGKGLAAFRNRWDGADDIVAQFYAKQGSAGWNQAEAGCFQIYGLGNGWAAKDCNAMGKTGSRWLDNAVVLPDDPFNAWGHGRMVYFRGDEKTGSGVATIDLNDVYMGLEQAGEKKTAVDLGIRGLRSFGADFSGKSGSPGLFAVVDKITGGQRKVWVHQVPAGATVSVAPDGFACKTAQATYNVTFVSPRNVKVAQEPGRGAQKISGVPDSDRPVIQVTGPTGKEGEFFAVMSLQKGDAPAVRVAGEGLGARATVGSQSVSFDGAKVVFGE